MIIPQISGLILGGRYLFFTRQLDKLWQVQIKSTLKLIFPRIQISWTLLQDNVAVMNTDSAFFNVLHGKLGITYDDNALKNMLYAYGCGSLGIPGSGGAICYSCSEICGDSVMSNSILGTSMLRNKAGYGGAMYMYSSQDLCSDPDNCYTVSFIHILVDFHTIWYSSAIIRLFTLQRMLVISGCQHITFLIRLPCMFIVLQLNLGPLLDFDSPSAADSPVLETIISENEARHMNEGRGVRGTGL